MSNQPLIENGRLFYVDIDRTLVEPIQQDLVVLNDSIVDINGYKYLRIQHNIEIVKRFGHHPGLKIIFWSAGGGAWAFAAAEALGLSQYGIAFISKPSWYIDDLKNAGFVDIEGTWIDALDKSNWR